MKKIFKIILMCFLVLPTMLSAEIKGENLDEALKNAGIDQVFSKYEEKEDEGTLYVFISKGDSTCNDLLNYLNSIYEEYSDFINIVVYEVSQNKDNKELMDNVADLLSTQVSNTPFMVIGESYIPSFNITTQEGIKTSIKLIHEKDKSERKDKIEEALVRYYRNYDLLITITVLFLLLLVGFMVYASFVGKKEK